ncbi:hypothetical protein Trydic_g5938 [Trypoxylus dichotomus]
MSSISATEPRMLLPLHSVTKQAHAENVGNDTQPYENASVTEQIRWRRCFTRRGGSGGGARGSRGNNNDEA